MTTQPSRRPAGTTSPAGPPPLTPQQAAWIRSELASGRVTVYQGDCLDVLPTLPDASVDAVVTDPPYELGFMGKSWDASGIAYDPALWTEVLRVLKPGGHLVAFGGTRTWHRLACAIEDSGFEIRDSIHWIYASGFPKSLNVAKAIASGGGRPQDIRRMQMGSAYRPSGRGRINYDHGSGSAMDAGPQAWAPPTEDAARWDGWGTALKPAHEPIVLARKPLAGTVAGNVLEHGTGALNIDGCRIAAGQDYRDKCASVVGLDRNRNGDVYGEWTGVRQDSAHQAGRWPTNVVLSHPPILADGEPVGDACADGCVPGCPVAELDRQSGTPFAGYSDTGGASRFFPVFRYEAKAPSHERPRLPDGTAHTTVKPVALMRWLVRLVTPPGGLILDPFAGSGTTGEACIAEGFRAVLIEREEPYAELIKQRLDKPIQSALDLGEAL